jgi:P-type conjugative transfer protein TrbL
MDPSNILDQVVGAFQAVSYPTLLRVIGPAQTLFVTLFAIDFAWDLATWSLTDTPDLFTRALHKFVVFLILWGALITTPFWLPQLVGGFDQIGRHMTGLGGLSPSAILDQGISLSFVMWLLWDPLTGILDLPAQLLWRGVASSVLLLGFSLVAFQLVRILVEVALALSGLAFFLGFWGSKLTYPLAEGYLRYLVNLGVRMFTCYLLIAVGQNFGNLWLDQFGNLNGGATGNPWALVAMPVAGAMWGGLVLILPEVVARRIGDSFSLSSANPLRHG